jgi:hypothetical protein
MNRLSANPIETINRLSQLSGVSNSLFKDWMFARLASENEGRNQEVAIALKQGTQKK